MSEQNVNTQENNVLTAYSGEIAPLVRTVILKGDLVKDFKESDEGAKAIIEEIKALQKKLKEYVEGHDEGKELVGNLKEAQKDLKEALKSAASATKKQDKEYKPAELKTFFVARAKQNVKKAVAKGTLFVELTNKVGTV